MPLVFSTIHQCSISSSCDTDSARSVSVSCSTSLAILTLLEAVLQHFCSSTLCLQQGRGSTLDSLFLQKLLWRHNVTFLSKSSFSISAFSFPLRSLVLEILFSNSARLSGKLSPRRTRSIRLPTLLACCLSFQIPPVLSLPGSKRFPE